MLNTFLLIVLPYICLTAMVLGICVNLFSARLRISAPATGFFENRKQFWGSVFWHYGILVVLAGHFAGALFPDLVKHISGSYRAMVILETIALTCGVSAFIGVAVFIFRRVTQRPIAVNSGIADYLILAVLCAQIVLGLIIAVKFRWGISWYASNLSGYLKDIFTFHPTAAKAAGMPPVVAAHIVCGFILLALLPYTKLMHLLYVPVRYLFRRPQIIVFYDRQK